MGGGGGGGGERRRREEAGAGPGNDSILNSMKRIGKKIPSKEINAKLLRHK